MSEPQTPDLAHLKAQDELGLNVDMLDVDRLRDWADKLGLYGADVTHWCDLKFLIKKLTDIASRLEQEVRDVGMLRAELSAWKQALDELHVSNWIGIIDGLTPGDTVRKLLEYALDQERDELKASLTQKDEEIAALKEVLDDKRRLAREIGIALDGVERAAKQPSLCDLVAPISALRAERDALKAENERLRGYVQKCAICGQEWTHVHGCSGAAPR